MIYFILTFIYIVIISNYCNYDNKEKENICIFSFLYSIDVQFVLYIVHLVLYSLCIVHNVNKKAHFVLSFTQRFIVRWIVLNIFLPHAFIYLYSSKKIFRQFWESVEIISVAKNAVTERGCRHERGWRKGSTSRPRQLYLWHTFKGIVKWDFFFS